MYAKAVTSIELVNLQHCSDELVSSGRGNVSMVRNVLFRFFGAADDFFTVAVGAGV